MSSIERSAPSGPRSKWIALLILLMVAGVAGAWILRTRRIMPADLALPKVGHLEFVGEHVVNDGGSHIFDFRAGTYGWIGVMVRHRSAEFGASPEFQEIRLWRREQEHLVLEPQSQSEQHLLRLLRSASIKTNRWSETPTRPSDERLRWLINRIQNRRSLW